MKIPSSASDDILDKMAGFSVKSDQSIIRNPFSFSFWFSFYLDDEESEVLRSKLLMLESKEGKGRYSKYNFKAFTERCNQDKAQVHPQG